MTPRAAEAVAVSECMTLADAAVAWVLADDAKRSTKKALQDARAAFYDDTAHEHEPARLMIEYRIGEDEFGNTVCNWFYTATNELANDDPIVKSRNKAYAEWRAASRSAGARLQRLRKLARKANGNP